MSCGSGGRTICHIDVARWHAWTHPLQPHQPDPPWANRRIFATLVAVSEVASRELRNNTRQLLDRVEAGEDITITVDGRPVAVLRPIEHRTRWLPRQRIAELLAEAQADPALGDELRTLMPDTTDDTYPP